MPYYCFKPTATIAQYFPMLLKERWWEGYKNPNDNNVYLTGEDIPESYKALVIPLIDVEATKDKL